MRLRPRLVVLRWCWWCWWLWRRRPRCGGGAAAASAAAAVAGWAAMAGGAGGGMLMPMFRVSLLTCDCWSMVGTWARVCAA